jgi:hypothetical protein
VLPRITRTYFIRSALQSGPTPCVSCGFAPITAPPSTVKSLICRPRFHNARILGFGNKWYRPDPMNRPSGITPLPLFRRQSRCLPYHNR